jgi:hypothetical protein
MKRGQHHGYHNVRKGSGMPSQIICTKAINLSFLLISHVDLRKFILLDTRVSTGAEIAQSL